jgi:(p)ppGpp synthase/HD superfamily hydrolase
MDAAMAEPRSLMTPRLERAMRWAAVCHQRQIRHGSPTPYFEHVAAVAWILDRLGCDEDTVIAGLLHDIVEDTQATLDQVRNQFGHEVAVIVAACSEVKTDAEGRKRPWIDRKRDHIEALAGATVDALMVVLADKLHNLICIELDLEEGRQVWSQFHADRAQVLWYYRSMIERFGMRDPRLMELAERCREVLERLDRFPVS